MIITWLVWPIKVLPKFIALQHWILQIIWNVLKYLWFRWNFYFINIIYKHNCINKNSFKILQLQLTIRWMLLMVVRSFLSSVARILILLWLLIIRFFFCVKMNFYYREFNLLNKQFCLTNKILSLVYCIVTKMFFKVYNFSDNYRTKTANS